MKMRPFLFMLAIVLFFILAACSNSDESYSDDGMESPASDMPNRYDGEAEEGDYSYDSGDTPEEGKYNYDEDRMQPERKVVNEGYMTIETKELSKTKNNIELLVSQLGGYVIQSSIYDYGEENRTSQLIVRVPSKDFQHFLVKVEEFSGKVIERTVRGHDVTEEYTDLESRLKAKEIVEKRLLTFLDGANKTEDLLRISNDLARVQQEIEQIKGRINYLKNHVDYATVTIHINEKKVIVPEITKDDLNILERSQKAFINSVNAIINFASIVVVGLIGFAPYLLLFVLPFSYILVKVLKRLKQNKKNNNDV
ncbi:hypothetical protein CIB95_07570 [Lottiidibacillus patelloidae]|uniref:DUF4349 domain-containing protein n=1 Tax=Lottiidibacillus patelloidae TaxID=2670334 RepID=A0A263BUF0_9BACI|nr:DUF4349 domain-containing protein [Lottiidibacillus patelloidae]OZM57315.1 hypothetical protein CIB95_07570 [Lottiidibacillus patelloidae]